MLLSSAHRLVSLSIAYLLLTCFDCHMVLEHKNDIIWASWGLKSSATRLFVQQLFHINSKKTPKSTLLALCKAEYTAEWLIPPYWSVLRKDFSCHDVPWIIENQNEAIPLKTCHQHGPPETCSTRAFERNEGWMITIMIAYSCLVDQFSIYRGASDKWEVSFVESDNSCESWSNEFI